MSIAVRQVKTSLTVGVVGVQWGMSVSLEYHTNDLHASNLIKVSLAYIFFYNYQTKGLHAVFIFG